MENNNNVPELQNPMLSLMLGNMPGLPSVIQNAMPIELPRPSFLQGPISLMFTNFKIGQLAKAQRGAADIAEYSLRAVKAKFETINEVLTFSAKVSDSLAEYEHKKTMRALSIQDMQASIYIKNAQAQQIGFEAKLSELDYNIKLKQYKQMTKEE